MNFDRNSGAAQAASNAPKRATTRERVAMAAGWPVADAIPDRLYADCGFGILDYWERAVLRSNRFEQLEWLARDLGALAEASAYRLSTARAVVAAFVSELIERGVPLPADPHAVAARWFEEGRSGDADRVFLAWRGLGDPKHKPTRPVESGR